MRPFLLYQLLIWVFLPCLSLHCVAQQPSRKTTTPKRPAKPPIRHIIHQRPIDPTTEVLQQEDEAPILHYYKGSKTASVKIETVAPGRQRYVLYNRQGTPVYELSSNIQASFQESVTLHFRADGSVERANIHMNPGASMYWYETDITFSEQNEPQWRTSRQFPEHAVRLPNQEYWDKSTRLWRKQETAICQPPRE